MQEVNIQMVSLEVLQRGLQLAPHRRTQVGVSGGTRKVPSLGGQHDGVAGNLPHEMAEEPLRAAVPVNVGCVEQVRAKPVGSFQAKPGGRVLGGRPAHR